MMSADTDSNSMQQETVTLNEAVYRQSAAAKAAVAFLSVLLSILLFALACVTIATAFLRPAVIKGAVAEADIAALLDETSVSHRDVIDFIYLERVDSSRLSNDSIKAFLGLDSVRAVLQGTAGKYIDAIAGGEIDYHITQTDIENIWKTLGPELDAVLGAQLTDDDYAYLKEKSPYEFGAYNIGRILYDAGIDSSVPYCLLSDIITVVPGIICVLLIFNILMLQRKNITAGLVYAGVPVLAAGALYIGAGLLLGQLSYILVSRGFNEISYAAGFSGTSMTYGIICAAPGIAAIAAAVVIKVLRKNKPSAAVSGKRIIWRIVTPAVNAAVLALCAVLIVSFAGSLPSGEPEIPYYITIKGTEYSTTLTALELLSSELEDSDIMPLRYMLALGELNLTNNNISDISPLAGLTNLNTLRLANNKIDDIAPLAGLTKLETLNLENNLVNDISPLAEMVNLTGLYLSNNQIGRIPPRLNLQMLSALLAVNNQIDDISGLSGLGSLTILHLSDNKISDISALSGLRNLETLRMDGNAIGDAGPLRDMKKVHTLYLNDNKVSDISAVGSMSSLKVLALNNNQIEDVSGLAPLSELTVLNLNNNKIQDTSPLAEIPTIISGGCQVYLEGNPVTDIMWPEDPAD